MAIPWTWIDLLEQLARSFPFLKYEECAPPRTYEGMLSLLRKGHRRLGNFNVERPTGISRESYIFLRRHNLATGIEGLYLPSFSLLRERRKMWVASSKVARLMACAKTLGTRAELGNVLSTALLPQSRTIARDWLSRPGPIASPVPKPACRSSLF